MDERYPEQRKAIRQQYTLLGNNKTIPKRTLRRWHSQRCHRSERHGRNHNLDSSEMGSAILEETQRRDDTSADLRNNSCSSSNTANVVNLDGINDVSEESDSVNGSENLSEISVIPESDTDVDAAIGHTEEFQSEWSNQQLEQQNRHFEDTINPPNDAQDTVASSTPECNAEKLKNVLLIGAIKLRHNLTYVAAEDISKLLAIETESPGGACSKYTLKKIVDTYSAAISVHHTCDDCNLYIGKQSNSVVDDEDETLYCDECEKEVSVRENTRLGNVFLHLSLIDQLRAIHESLGDRDFINPNERNKENLYAIEDMVDGALYKKKATNNMISLTCNIDGVPIFENSKTSAWPVLCTINELHPQIRPRNVLIASIWCGKGKPLMTEYLRPFVNEAKILDTEGFDYVRHGRHYNKRCSVVVSVCDSVARPLVQNTTQFNGKFGCGICLHPGEQIAKGRGTVRIYPLDFDDNPYGEGIRTAKDTLGHAATKEKGVKGVSILFDIPDFDPIAGVIPDWMHAVALGVVRQFAHLWFDTSYKDKPFYFGDHLKVINELLLSYKPSLDVSRTPWKISDYSTLKAHELAMWLLCYSLPTLKKIFSSKYVEHWSLLVEGISILLKKSIMKSEIHHSHKCLLAFVKNVEPLYGREHISYNVHLLTHLAQSVLDWGPLWSHSAFVFENFNQEIKSFVKSSQGVATQICDNFRLKYTINTLRNECENVLSEREQIFLDSTLNRKTLPKVTLSLDYAEMIGRPVLKKIDRKHFLAFQRIHINIDQNHPVQYYGRAFVNKELIHSKKYRRATKRASYFVFLKDKEIFEISTFVVFSYNNTPECYVIGRYYEKEHSSLVSGVRLEHIVILKEIIPDLAVVHASTIQEKVIVLNNYVTNTRVACIHSSRSELLS